MNKLTMNSETEFFGGLIELQYGQEAKKKLKRLAESIPWARGWPEDKKAFWNAEAFMWQHKISKEKRRLIGEELRFLQGGKNLDLGCGAYSYLPSIGLDISDKMLQLNEQCREKITGDWEKTLPFPDGRFDSVTAVFTLNYVENHLQLLSEIKRVLKDKGIFVMILSSKEINEWQRQKEVNSFPAGEWSTILRGSGFRTDFYEKGGLLFFRGVSENFLSSCRETMAPS